VGRVWPRHGHRGRPLNSVVSHHSMSRANVAIITSSALLLASFAVFATSHLWLRGSNEKDLGLGVIVVGTFFLLHVVVTVALVWATLSAAIAWRNSTVPRKASDRTVLLIGIVASAVATAYAVFFIAG
jgi:hypothetical protein